jgi:CAAX protease family protein
MTTIALPAFESERPAPLAPAWHTALLVALFLGLAAGGAFFQQAASAQPAVAREHPHVAPLYLSLIAAEWGLFVFVWRGSKRRSGGRLRDLSGGRWTTWSGLLSDALLALAVWGVWSLGSLAWDRWMGAGSAVSIESLLPRRAVEIALWVALSISAGVCEEVVFRGYFQKQFESLTNSPSIALVMQAALFGVAHGYQGLPSCLKIALYGVLFGALALWRKSLRPGIIAHAWTDISAGLFGI